MNIEKRLQAVRQEMKANAIDAFLIPRADEYLGEYVAASNERLHWISGFSGSAGAIVVKHDMAAIFVDGRYTIQVRQQVPESLFEFHHLIEEPPVDWVCRTMTQGSTIGMDTRLHTYGFYKKALTDLKAAGMTLLELSSNPIDTRWSNRPTKEPELALLLEENYTGEHSTSKRSRIGALISDAGADVALISQLDSIAWLLNIRGADISRLPVLLGYAYLYKNGDLTFFTDPRKIPNDFHDHVGPGVTIKQETLLTAGFTGLGESSSRVLLDEATCNAHSYLRCLENDCEVILRSDPVILPKAQKNPVELAGARNCHIRDGSALTRFLAWVDAEVKAGRLHDEGVLADQLEAFRRELHNIHDLSFDTISAAGANGAMCHYSHLNGTPSQLEMNSLYLVDSGGQFSDGTTDVTRTVVIGEASREHRRMFTLVLKGHIALGRAVFPRGTTGVQLDVLARQFLWQEGLDYDHGTGHGVGAFLSVHEGPQRIGKVSGPLAQLLPGMILSNEPGFYKEGCYGIRCENLMIIIEREDGMMNFEIITFAPFDRRLIDTEIMTPDELDWLNEYHAKVRRHLSEILDGDDLAWLERSTASL